MPKKKKKRKDERKPAFALTQERSDMELNGANWVANHKKLETSYVECQTDYYLMCICVWKEA